MNIQEAREYVAKLADKEGETQFAREVRAGAWDHRRDVQSALVKPFVPRALNRPADESPSYRAAMIDAGRGRLLR